MVVYCFQNAYRNRACPCLIPTCYYVPWLERTVYLPFNTLASETSLLKMASNFQYLCVCYMKSRMIAAIKVQGYISPGTQCKCCWCTPELRGGTSSHVRSWCIMYYLTLCGQIERTGTQCKHATATGAMYIPLMFDTCTRTRACISLWCLIHTLHCYSVK